MLVLEFHCGKEANTAHGRRGISLALKTNLTTQGKES